MSNEGKDRQDLLDARLTLEPPHVPDDVGNVTRSHRFDLRHVAEIPMMRTDSAGCRHLEGLIAVMIRLINLVHERRAVIGPSPSFTVADRAIGFELRLAGPEFRWDRTSFRLG